MLRVTILVASIAFADSANPATIGPALYLATVRHSVRRVGEFTAAFLLVNLVAGILIVAGPGQLLVSLASKPSDLARHVVELVVGVVLVGVAIALIVGRTRLAAVGGVGESGGRLRSGHAWALGATIATAELPTAVPYFAALAAIVGSGVGLVRQLLLVVLFNLIFVAPLLAIMAAVAFGGERAERRLRLAGDWLRRRWPLVFASVALALGLALTALGLLYLVSH